MDVPVASQSVNVLLDVSAVSPPLSGIGRYALELARHLPSQEGVGEVAYLRGNQVTRSFESPASSPPPRSGKLREFLKQVLPYKLVLAPYRRRKSRALAASLTAYSDFIFHSPNFGVPPVAGKSVVTLHDLSVFHFPAFHPQDRVNYIRDQVHHSIERADRIITDSEFVRSELLDLFDLEPSRVIALPLGVSETFRPRATEDLQPLLQPLGLRPGKYLLSVGTIEPRKNLEELLQAYSLLEQSLRREYPLVIAGAYGWNSDALVEKIQRLQASGDVIYLDYVPEADLPSLYAGAAVFCYFSYYEGFGLPVLEAMSSGVPVVCADTSALPELCGDASLQVSPGHVEGMAAALRQSLVDADWRAVAIRKGIARAANYRWDLTAAGLVSVFRALHE